MENVSKALIMAGGVLIGVLILSLVVYSYRQLSAIGNQDYDQTVIRQQKDFNAQWEKFNGNVYGSDVLSIANLIEDYNTREADNKGYTTITTQIDLKDTKLELIDDIHTNEAKNCRDNVCNSLGIDKNVQLTGNLGEGREKDIYLYNKAIERAIEQIGKIKKGTPNSRTVSYLSGLSSTKLTQYNLSNTDKQLLNEYTALIQKQKSFKNTKFTTELAYDNLTGRVCKITITKR